MAWGTWTLGTESTTSLGLVPGGTTLGLAGETYEAPVIRSVLGCPMLGGLLTLDGDNRIATAGTPPEPVYGQPMRPGWRRANRKVG